MKKILLAVTAFLLAFGGAYAQCTPSFTATMSSVSSNLLTVLFTNTSSISTTPPANYVFYTINFGDGTSANYFNPSHVYNAPGTYNVKLVATKIDSISQSILCKDSVTIPVTVYYTSCASTFTSVVSSSTPGLVTFTASTPAGTPNMHYFWNFGDGTSGTGSPVNHIYTTTGNHIVTFTAIDSITMCSYSYQTGVTTNSSSCANHYASFTANTYLATVTFNSLSQDFPGQIKTINWSFGDGTTGTGSPVSHTYATTGSHMVTSTVQWVDSLNPSIIICTQTNTYYVTTTSPTYCNGHTASISGKMQHLNF